MKRYSIVLAFMRRHEGNIEFQIMNDILYANNEHEALDKAMSTIPLQFKDYGVIDKIVTEIS